MYKIYTKLLNPIFSLIFSLQDITSQNLKEIVKLYPLPQDITSQNLHEIVKLYLFPHVQSSRYHFPKLT